MLQTVGNHLKYTSCLFLLFSTCYPLCAGLLFRPLPLQNAASLNKDALKKEPGLIFDDFLKKPLKKKSI
jgi:hypothetical protein